MKGRRAVAWQGQKEPRACLPQRAPQGPAGSLPQRPEPASRAGRRAPAAVRLKPWPRSPRSPGVSDSAAQSSPDPGAGQLPPDSGHAHPAQPLGPSQVSGGTEARRCGGVANLPQGHLRPVGAAPARTRVSPRQGPGSQRLRARGRRGRRRGLPAFQQLAEPALHLLLRGTWGQRGVSRRRARTPARRPPPATPRTCAALRHQLAGPLTEGVHGARDTTRSPSGPSRALRRASARRAPRARPL